MAGAEPLEPFSFFLYIFGHLLMNNVPGRRLPAGMLSGQKFNLVVRFVLYVLADGLTYRISFFRLVPPEENGSQATGGHQPGQVFAPAVRRQPFERFGFVIGDVSTSNR